ncbi:MAG: FAD-dependent oxidoreductase, partial [Pontibacterium sp.]
MRKIYDYIVIGGGIVGVATARELVKRYPDASIVLVEKEEQVAAHQTGRNSGVIHAGVYYKPGSLKAQFCREGNVATKAFCDAESIPYETCGKLLVATDAQELERMQDLIQRCQDNELEYEVLDQDQLREREPNVTGIGAIFIPSSGIVNYAAITQRMLEQIQAAGVEVVLGAEVTKLEEFADRVTVFTTKDRYQARFIVS